MEKSIASQTSTTSMISELNKIRLPLKMVANGSPKTVAVHFKRIKIMKTRNIINSNNEDSTEPFAVAQHVILKNFWEYYLEEADENGIAFGYVMGVESEWGSVSMDEIKPYIVSIARGKELDYIMPPEGYYWENEKEYA